MKEFTISNRDLLIEKANVYLRRHTGEALSPGKVVDRDRVKGNVTLLLGCCGTGNSVIFETAGSLVGRLIVPVVQAVGREASFETALYGLG